MEKGTTTTTPQPVCAAEAVDLLNCVASPDYDRDRCLRFVDALRDCVLQKKVKVFTLSESKNPDEGSASKATK